MIGLLWSFATIMAEPELDPESFERPPLGFYAVNVGYKDNEGVSSQNYDFFELRKGGEESLSLDGYALFYINSSGTRTEISIPEKSTMVGESLVFGYAKSPQFKDADERYLYNLGSAGLASTSATLQLFYEEELIDELCWGTATCANNVGKFATTEEQNYSYVKE